MSLSNKIPLPDSYIEEMEEYQRISSDPSRSTSGDVAWTNPRTLASYTTVGTIYQNQGSAGLALLLYNVSPPKLKDYIYDADTYSEMVDGINQSLETILPTSGTSNAIVVNVDMDGKFQLEIASAITGNITINKNGDGAKVLYTDYALTEQATELEAGIYTIWDKSTAFLLASKSGGNITWLQQYDGTNAILKDDKGKDVTVKTGEYVYNEFYETFINDGGSGQTIPPTTKATVFTDLQATIDGILEMANPETDQVYQGFKSKVMLFDNDMNGKGCLPVIKSIQSGGVSATNYNSPGGTNVTISEIDPSKSIILFNRAGTIGASTQVAQVTLKASIVDANTINFELGASTGIVYLYWQVIEYENVKSLQKGDKTILNSGESVVISSVNVDKCIVISSFYSTNTGGLLYYTPTDGGGRLNNATSLGLTTGNANNDGVIHWQILEFN